MRFPRFVPLYVFLTLGTLHLLAQSPDGNINGLVSDPSSSAVVGAQVVAVNDVTGVQYTTKTNSEGIYILPNLPSGPYRIQVSKIGFKTIIKPDIVLNVQDALSINFTLPVGAVFEVLTVEGGAPLVNTESAAVSTVVDQSYVKNMPLNGRSFQDLILLTPGVVTQSPQQIFGTVGLGKTGEFSVNGQRTESNTYTVDGVSANVGATAGSSMVQGAGSSGSIASSTALGTTQALVSVDDLQEFRAQSSSYSAEYGRNPGGQFSFETKSGTNQWHGTAFDYLRNGIFDAQDWFDDYFGVKQPALRQNDFGGTLGGQVRVPHLYNGKDRSFFFVSYEGLRLVAPQAATANLVPDESLRASAPAVVQQALNAFPLPSPEGLDFGDGIGQFIGSWSNPSSLNSTSVRFDHLVNDKLKLFFRFSDTRSESAARGTSTEGSTPSVINTSAYTLRTYTVSANSMFTNRVNNEFRLNYSSNDARSYSAVDPFGGSTPINLRRLSGLSPGSTVGFYPCYDGCFDLLQMQQSGAQRQWNLVDALNLSVGRHQFKFGVDYRRLTPLAVPASPQVFYFYFDETSVETNSATVYLETDALAHPLYQNFSAFAQDEWKASKRLTLSLGIRWEVNPAPGVTQGLSPYVFQGASPDTFTLAAQGTPLWQTTWHNFAPRFGAAYILRKAPQWETVVRAGGGVFFDTGQQLGSLGFAGPGFSANNSQDGVPGSFPVPGVLPVIVNPPVPPFNEGTAPVAFPKHLQLPYTLQWNATVEQALGASQSLTISYVGSHAVRLLRESIFQPSQNPNANFFYFVENGSTSDYDALQGQFRRRLNRGLTALASYTWSHCLDYGSSNFSIGYQRGNCDFDIRHSLSAAFSYDLPNRAHGALARTFFNQWGIDDRITARTAFPVTLVGQGLILPNGQSYDAGLSFVQSQPVYLYGANCASVLQSLNQLKQSQACPGDRAINPLAFVTVSSGFGDAPRNFARLFGAWQMDMAIRRDFPIHEGLMLRFRAEAFNLFNHPNFGTVQPILGRNTFGQATATLANSLGILSPLYQMGGSRSMQFALKVVF